ncbi:Uncharacterised protein [Mycobacteroides abscessus subsp. abscessus]|nr:Uncharacterised protein [Mycobacteroides abscessus subsp. abscessus]
MISPPWEAPIRLTCGAPVVARTLVISSVSRCVESWIGASAPASVPLIKLMGSHGIRP